MVFLFVVVGFVGVVKNQYVKSIGFVIGKLLFGLVVVVLVVVMLVLCLVGMNVINGFFDSAIVGIIVVIVILSNISDIVGVNMIGILFFFNLFDIVVS